MNRQDSRVFDDPEGDVSMKHSLLATAAFAALSLVVGIAHAQSAGQALVKIGFGNVSPQVRSSDLPAPAPPNSQIDFGSSHALIVSAGYMFTDNWSWEFLAGLPYDFDVRGAGAIASAGSLGNVHASLPTAMLQYRFLPAWWRVRPYVGAGLTYGYFYNTTGSAALTALFNAGGKAVTIGSDRSVGVSSQAGLTVKVTEQWYVDAAVMKTFISSSLPLSTGQSLSARLNPVSASVAVGYRF